ncbi:GMC oxidoreductase, partial [Pyrenophora tritici-repentis]
QDLDNWAELGNKGWSFDELKPYYRKFETYHPASEALGGKIDDKYLDESLRGTSGPINICFPDTNVTWQQELWPKTIINAGYSPVKDPRIGSAIGGFNQLNTIDPKHNRRSYSAREYYEPNSGRPNMSLLTNALVSKVKLEGAGSDVKATGVRFIVDGTTHAIKATREVIVCGGSVNSPQILELSGIGCPAVLQKAGVKVLVDLPGVGENLCDHTVTGISLGVKDEYLTAEVLDRNPERMQQALEAYITHKTGPLVGAPTTTGFASLSQIQPEFPNRETHIQSLIADFAMTYPNADQGARNPLIARQLLDPEEAVCQIIALPLGANPCDADTPNKVLLSKEEGMWMTLGVCSTRSLSRGSVHLHNSDPKAHPRIDPAYLSHPLDLDMMARATLHVLSFTKIEPLASVLRRDANGDPVLAQNCRVPRGLEEAKEFVKEKTLTMYHPVGTCAMLPREQGGVVDAELRVYGVSGLRVVDASIFPTHVQGNIVSLVYAVAEKASDLIKGVGINSVDRLT